MKKNLKKIKKQLNMIKYSGFLNKVSSYRLFNKRESLHDFFIKKYDDFYKKKIPFSNEYPYTVHDPYLVLNEKSGYHNFYLIGDNWLEKKAKKPIALMVGFNDWKFGFTSDYLPQYRTAYTKRLFLPTMAHLSLCKLEEKPSVFIVWGYNENSYINYYSKKHNIPLYRMEDGFVRSSLLGASHATPYSLILDKKGLYYNPQTESDIENILNTYDFSMDKKLLAESEKALKLLIDLKISKYNQPNITEVDTLGIKIKKRVVVLGQVDGDAAIRYGNPEEWSSEELVKLARYENPEADVYYRPHPEVYKGYQRSRFNQKKVEYFAKVVSPEEPLLDFLETMDHVYTINSLSGLEALLRGKKVTVVGAAFYAGWGLTDDRVEMERRERKLSLHELFAGVYLKYPMYLADLNNSYMGLQTASYRIKAEQNINKYDLFNALEIEENQTLLQSSFWPQLFFKKASKEMREDISEQIDFTKKIESSQNPFYQKVYLYAIFGLIEDSKKKIKFLNKIKTSIDINIYYEFILTITPFFEETFIQKEILWIMSQENFTCDIDNELLEVTKVNEKKLSISNISTQKIDLVDDSLFGPENSISLKNMMRVLNIDKQKDLFEIFTYEEIIVLLDKVNESAEDDVSIYKKEISEYIFNFYEYYMSKKDYDKAIKLAESMLLFGLNTNTMLLKLTNYAKLRFDFSSVIELSELNQTINLYAQNRNMSLTEMMVYSENDIQKIGKNNFLIKLIQLVILKPNVIDSASFIIQKYNNIFDEKEILEILELVLSLDNEISIRKAQSLIAIGKTSQAVKVIESLILIEENILNIVIAYSQALSSDDKVEDAILHIENRLKKIKSKDLYHEAIRLYVINNDYEKAILLIQNANSNNVKLGEMYLRKVYFGNRLINNAFKTFLEIPPKKAIASYYSDKYLNHEVKSYDYLENQTLILLSIFGPGDEMRFASIYKLLKRIFPETVRIKITCSPKLFNLFNRSFPDIEFIISEKLRDADFDYGKSNISENYSKVPGFDLVRTIDNKGHEAIENSDKVVMVTDLLHKLLFDYQSFSDTAYLLNNKRQTSQFKKLLPKENKLIGLSWRSSLTTHSRNEHYLTIEELEPLFSLDNVTFVNFQYDECSEELAWVENRYPGKLINIDTIDQYNDLDSVASLLKCMDLVIAPATTVVELSGALGCPTWMFSNSSELDWRKINKNGIDVWHESITIIDGDTAGDKISLVTNLKNKLDKYINN